MTRRGQAKAAKCPTRIVSGMTPEGQSRGQKASMRMEAQCNKGIPQQKSYETLNGNGHREAEFPYRNCETNRVGPPVGDGGECKLRRSALLANASGESHLTN